MIHNKSSTSERRPALVSAQELAEMLQISTRTLWRLRASGQIVEPLKIGGATRWRLDEVDDWISRGCPEVGCRKE